MSHLERRRVVELSDLVLDGLDYFLPAMPGIAAPEARCSIQNLTSVGRRVMHVFGADKQAGILLELPVCRKRHPECVQIVGFQTRVRSQAGTC